MISYTESAADYHKNTAVGSGDLRAFLKSPRLYADIRAGLVKRETKPMLFGTNAHMSLLEPERYAKTAVTEPDQYPAGAPVAGLTPMKPWSNNANFCKAWHAEQQAKGLVVLSPEDRARLQFMHERCPDAIRAILARSKCEVTVRHKMNGIECQARVDAWDMAHGKRYDLKTIRAMESLESEIWKRGYHIQDRFYGRLIKAEMSQPIQKGSGLIFAETAAPFRWRVVELDADYQALADRDIDEALRGIAARNKSGCWDDPEAVFDVASPPDFLTNELDEDDEDAA